ncbi:hypothetical protein [Legionella sainthelensi]|uniref:Ankyrin repeat protein n=1 Tax=Legionella sainthelensi TaxID=28087 RepID=A0A2H5FMA1_9GAMM|nr:hypothetical protein [Legionella sainthelensi]AUH72663.1 hypothetical protein CAB17_11835 [Legionella sainthelensi]
MKTNTFFTPRQSCESITADNFETKYAEYFNSLREATKYNKLNQINLFKSALTRNQFLKLMHDKNCDYSDCAIIHYAAKWNRPSAIQALVEDLSHEERLSIFKMKYSTRCNTLHFTATVNDRENTNCSYEAAVKIKELLYLENDHHFWIKLLEEQQYCLETSVHYAARQPSSNLLKLLSDGLDECEWLKIISLKNDNNRTAVDVYFINMNKNYMSSSSTSYISALRGPLKSDNWVRFLLSNNVLQGLDPDNPGEAQYFQEIIKNLSPELIQILVKDWQKFYPDKSNRINTLVDKIQMTETDFRAFNNMKT